MNIIDQDDASAETLDRTLQAVVGRATKGLSPASFLLAFYDWYFHILIHPGKQAELLELHQKNMMKIIELLTCVKENCAQETPKDKRFADPSWQQYPYHLFYQSFLMMQDWWHQAAINVRGVSEHHQEVVDFMLRQLMDMLSPSNYILTNPEILKTTFEQKGKNFSKGLENLMDDVRRYVLEEPPAGAENFVIGKNIAITPGKVVYRNRLIELIQYAPTTETVYAEPILITPAWIMKYYILDLTPKHSLVNYLVQKGHTVFMISWKNPQEEDRNLKMDDYIDLGILSSLKTISSIVPNKKVHLVGYCLGGTLAAITAATLARENDNRLASLTLLAAQTDFTEPGELGLFIDESQISFLENLMQEKGYLDTHQMAGAFQLLRSNDLIWSRMIHDYLLGSRKPLTDLMAWNADATRMPYKMHSEYLRELFLNNKLAEGKYLVKGKPIALTDIQIPIFVVATERDHVSPWHSVFKINLLTPVEVTFLLTSGGHNVGIVSMPSPKAKHHYRVSTLKEKERYIDADTWFASIQPEEGSWWPVWEKWLANYSTEQVTPPHIGGQKTNQATLEDAPGTYVLQK